MTGPDAIPTPLLDRSLLEADVIRRGEYAYFVHPLTDGVPPIQPALLAEVGAALERLMGPRPDLLLTAEAMGIPVATELGRRLGLPVAIARKRPYGLPGERLVAAKTGYGASTLHINGVPPGTRVTVVDDVVSTGGTLAALVEGARAAGIDVLEVLVVLSRGTGLQDLQARTDVALKALRQIEVDPRTNRVRLIGPGTRISHV